MEIQHIIESDKEMCVVCKESKCGRFDIINVKDKYIPICGDCKDAPISKDWLRHIYGKGYSKCEDE